MPQPPAHTPAWLPPATTHRPSPACISQEPYSTDTISPNFSGISEQVLWGWQEVSGEDGDADSLRASVGEDQAVLPKSWQGKSAL